MSKLDTKIINEQVEQVFNKFESAAETIIALDLVHRNVERQEYWYYYKHENDTLFEKSHLLCTEAVLITTQGKIENFDIVEQCTQERQNTRWRLKFITNVTIFAALPEPLLQHTQANDLLSDKVKQP